MTDNTAGAPAITGILLAAGAGRRLGGVPKALLPYRGGLLVEHAARVLRDGGCARVHVVLGAGAGTVRERAAGIGWCTVTDNPDWPQGMGSSLRVGLESLAGTGARAAIVALVDQPGVGARAVRRVLDAAEGTASRDVPAVLAAASYEGRRGHPVLLGAGHWPGIIASAVGDQGARAYLAAHRGDLTLVECADIAAPGDIDTPADLRLLDDEPPGGGPEGAAHR